MTRQRGVESFPSLPETNIRNINRAKPKGENMNLQTTANVNEAQNNTAIGHELTPADADAIVRAYTEGRILTDRHAATLLHLRNLLRFLCETASHAPQKGVLVSALMLLEAT